MVDISTDIDIDFKNRDDILKIIKHIPASSIRDNEINKHHWGVYLQKIPTDPITGFSSIHFEEAEKRGYCKFDFINNNGAYSEIASEEEINALLEMEPNWELLRKEEIVNQLPHIKNYHSLLQQHLPKSVMELAMFLALIRPGKKHLRGKRYEDITDQIWVKEDEGYMFKKAHAVSYALSIVVKLNYLDVISC